MDAHVSLPHDPYVSRQHFLLEISPPKCKVTDLESKNGTFVNGMRYGGRKVPDLGGKQAAENVKDVYLTNGDSIAVGDTCMTVSIVETPKDTPQKIIPNLPEQPQSVNQNVLCIRCHKDVTTEAGSKGQIAGAEYVCKACREEEAADPINIIENLLQDAVKKEAVPGAPSIQGYHIESLIARGGMGMVYKAKDVRNDRYVAVKTMLPEVATDPDNIVAFQREIEITRQLKHPNIVQLFEHGREQGAFYFILEFVEGVDLGEFMKSRGGTLPLADAAPIMIGSLDGLAYAHHARISMDMGNNQTTAFTGIVHRDLKPQNILLGRKGEHWFPKLTDFGISKSFESAGLTDITSPGEVLGTPMYWPREQITHYKYLNPATDVFSIAAVFYEMLTGKWVRGGFQELFDECKRKKRYPTIADYMNIMAKNPIIPIRKRNTRIPEPVAKVLDRALREVEIPHDEAKMRTTLTKLRYPDARFFRDALVDAFQEAGFAESVSMSRRFSQNAVTQELENRFSLSLLDMKQQQAAAGGEKQVQGTAGTQPLEQEKDHDTSPVSGNVIYSTGMGKAVSNQEVALFVIDLVQSTQFVLHFGDTYFSTLIGNMYKTASHHEAASDLIFMKSTGDGLLAAFHQMRSAFSLASTFLDTPPSGDIRLRIALHWGTVKFGPEGDVLGKEVHRVCRIEGIQSDARLVSKNTDTPLPEADRILVTEQGIQQLDAAVRKHFAPIGTFRLKGFADSTALWMMHKS